MIDDTSARVFNALPENQLLALLTKSVASNFPAIDVEIDVPKFGSSPIAAAISFNVFRVFGELSIKFAIAVSTYPTVAFPPPSS